MEGGVVLELEARPGSGTPRGLSYEPWRRRLRVSLSERAEGGRANAELLGLLSRVLGVPVRNLSITSGARDRRKSVLVAGLGYEEVLRRLAPHLRRELRRERNRNGKRERGVGRNAQDVG